MRYSFFYDGDEKELRARGFIQALQKTVEGKGVITACNFYGRDPKGITRVTPSGKTEGFKINKTYLNIQVILDKDTSQDELTNRISSLTSCFRGIELDAYRAAEEDSPAIEINAELTSPECMVKISPWYVDMLLNQPRSTDDTLTQIFRGGVQQVHRSEHLNVISISYTRCVFPDEQTPLSLVTQMILNTADELSPLFHKHKDRANNYSLKLVNGAFSGYTPCLDASLLKVRERLTPTEIKEMMREESEQIAKAASPASLSTSSVFVSSENCASQTIDLLMSSTGITSGWKSYKKGQVILLEHENKQNLQTIQNVLVKKGICEASCMRNAMTKMPVLKLTNINRLVAKQELTGVTIEIEKCYEKAASTSAGIR